MMRNSWIFWFSVAFIAFFSIVLAVDLQAAPAGWSDDTRLTNDTYNSVNPVIGVNGNNIHVVWQENRDGNNEIYYKRSIDNGENWGSDIRLTNDGGASINPAIAVNGNNVHVVWQDQRDGNWEIYYKHSTNNGDDWGSDMRLVNNDKISNSPAVAAHGNDIYVVWQDQRDGNYEVYFKHSTNNGDNWGSDIRLTNDISASQNPTVCAQGNTVHVMWQDDRDGNWEIYYKRSTNRGDNWGSDTRLTQDDDSSADPAMAVSGENIHVVWREDRDGNYEIYYKRSTNNGNDWGSDTRLTNDDQSSIDPVIAVFSNTINVVWLDNRDGDWDIFYKRSASNGDDWESDLKISTDEDSDDLSMAVNGNDIHVVWLDDRDSNYEIYYKNRPNLPPTADSLDFSHNHVYRNEEITIYANSSDDNDLESVIIPTCEYKAPSDGSWQTAYLSTAMWNEIGWVWEMTFDPDATAETGFYDFRVRFQDSDGLDSEYMIEMGAMDVREHPSALFTVSNTLVKEGGSVTFDGSISTGEDLAYYFDFGDGTTTDWTTETTINHTYSNNGSYMARLKVRDAYSEESLWSILEITVKVHPVAIVSVSNPKIKEGETVTFNGGASIGKTIEYYFEFGDGNTSDWTSNSMIDHSYSVKGTYTARLKVRDTYSEESLWSTVAIEVREAPAADLTASKTTIEEGESVMFDGGSSTGENLAYYFEFGDGNSSDWSSNSMIVYTYSEKGTYTARLKVRDEYLEESLWFVVIITVQEKESPNGIEDEGDDSKEGLLTLLVVVLIVVILVLILFNMKNENFKRMFSQNDRHEDQNEKDPSAVDKIKENE